MILLDTHVWIWWVHDDPMPRDLKELLEETHEALAVSAISCWEIAKLIELGRLDLPRDVGEWLELALEPSDVSLIPLTPEIAVESTQLPGDFHRDPADQIIVATSLVHGFSLATCDEKIRDYPCVRLFGEVMMIHDG